MSPRADASPAAQLRALMAEHSLTRPEIAQLAGVTLKTVESWLASDGSASRREMPARHLIVITAQLRKYLAARARRKT